MTTPKITTIKRQDSRFYVEPLTGEKYPGVTSVVGMLPKEFLQYWQAKMVATAAVEELGTVVQMTLRDPQAAIDHLKGAARRNTAEAARIGTDAHDLFERLAKGEDVGRVHPELVPYVDHFKDFLDKAQPEFLHMEETVWSDTHRYAGSFDWIARIGGEVIFGDNKTTRSGIHAEVGIQLSAYRYADCLLRPDGTRVPVPKAAGAAVFHVRPEGWTFTPVKADEEVFEVFKHLRAIFDYEKGGSSQIVGRPLLSGPDPNAAPKRRQPAARRSPAARAAA
ncbi:Cas4 family exonuclease [Microbacterium phage Cen1621]|uniref:Cas4 family exonuclease n=1 Tax=Microbacterium phage Cen1621 TaxID=2965191 RepID=A0A9E7Q9T8_9CAUD|nr:Cas4 family exonuclease [Microbacterium phage Cen1621]